MPNQLPAVLSTYATRRSVQLLVALGGAFCLFAFFAASADARQGVRIKEEVLGLLAFPTMIFAYLIASQGKWQFADPRARLVPNFAGNHLAVLGCLALLGLGLAPALLGWAARASALGAAATSIAIGASLIWLIQGKTSQSLLFGFGTFALMIRPGVAFWLAPDSAAAHWPYQFALLAAGWAAFGSWLVRLANLCEEQSDYYMPIFIQAGSPTRMERTQASRAAARIFRSGPRDLPLRQPGDKWHDRLAGTRTSTASARQRLLRYGFAAAPVWQMGVGGVFGFSVMLGVISMLRPFPESAIPSCFSAMNAMPALLAPGALIMRRGKMAQELLLPLTRRDYVDGLFVALARNAVIVWIILHSAMLAILALMTPRTMSLPFVVALTALSLSAYLYAFGVFTWVAQTPSAGLRGASALLLGLPAVGLLSVGINAITVKPLPPALPATIAASLEQPVTVAERTQAERLVNRHEEQVRQSRHTNPRLAWSVAASLSAIGAVCTVVSRRKWMDVELA